MSIEANSPFTKNAVYLLVLLKKKLPFFQDALCLKHVVLQIVWYEIKKWFYFVKKSTFFSKKKKRKARFTEPTFFWME